MLVEGQRNRELLTFYRRKYLRLVCSILLLSHAARAFFSFALFVRFSLYRYMLISPNVRVLMSLVRDEYIHYMEHDEKSEYTRDVSVVLCTYVQNKLKVA